MSTLDEILPLCWCGHNKPTHQHYSMKARVTAHCLMCGCNDYQPVETTMKGGVKAVAREWVPILGMGLAAWVFAWGGYRVLRLVFW